MAKAKSTTPELLTTARLRQEAEATQTRLDNLWQLINDAETAERKRVPRADQFEPVNDDQRIAALVEDHINRDQWEDEYTERSACFSRVAGAVYPVRFDKDRSNAWKTQADKYRSQCDDAIAQLAKIEAASVAGVALKLRLLEPMMEDIGWRDDYLAVLRSALDDAERLALKGGAS